MQINFFKPIRSWVFLNRSQWGLMILSKKSLHGVNLMLFHPLFQYDGQLYALCDGNNGQNVQDHSQGDNWPAAHRRFRNNDTERSSSPPSPPLPSATSKTTPRLHSQARLYFCAGIFFRPNCCVQIQKVQLYLCPAPAINATICHPEWSSFLKRVFLFF